MAPRPVDLRFPLRQFVGFELDTPGDGTCVGRCTVSPAHLNPNGVVHGGVIFTIVDTAMASACTGVLESGKTCASIEIHLRFLRPVTQGEMIVEANILKMGRRVIQLEAGVRNSAGNLLASASGSFAVVPAAS